jgi:FKBP-type peptidyl-prolyl cis-trans isomerase SlpA
MDVNIVNQHSFLTLHYRITLIHQGELLGDFLNTFDDKPATVLMGTGQLAPALETALLNLKQGDHTTVEFEEGIVFGQHNSEMVQPVSLSLLTQESELGSTFEVGDIIEFNTEQGRMAGTIVQLNEERAMVDFNHPLAGHAVAFEVQLISVL